MAQRGQAASNALQLIGVAVRDHDCGLVTGLGEDSPPGVDDQRVAVAGPVRAVPPALSGSEHEGLILDGARPEQHLPVEIAGSSTKRFSPSSTG